MDGDKVSPVTSRKGLRHRRSINREVAWITGRLPRGSTLSERALQQHWAPRLDDGFLQELSNTVCGVRYGAKKGRKGSIDGFITLTRTSVAVSRTAVKQLVVPVAAACLHGQRAPAMSRRSMTYSSMGRQRTLLDAKLQTAARYQTVDGERRKI